MSDLLTQEPAAEPAESPAPSAEPSAQPTAGESGRGEQQADPGRASRAMDALMRGTLGAPSATSKPAETDLSGEPAPSGDVEAGQSPPRGPDGKFLPRRGAAEAVRTAEERVADLERQLAERDPEKLRQQWEAERTMREATDTEAEQAKADAERYQALLHVPDRNLSDEDYRWREDYKASLEAAPAAVRRANALAERQIAAERQALITERDTILNGIAAEVRAGAKEFGVNPEAWGPKTGATWLSMTRDAVTAQTTPLKERIAELERELHSARTVGPNGLGTLRVPSLAGRSDGGSRSRTMDDWLRGR